MVLHRAFRARHLKHEMQHLTSTGSAIIRTSLYTSDMLRHDERERHALIALYLCSSIAKYDNIEKTCIALTTPAYARHQSCPVGHQALEACAPAAHPYIYRCLCV